MSNQASEDEIKQLLSRLKSELNDYHTCYYKREILDVMTYSDLQNDTVEEAAKTIQAIIRNEKLKLLAEIREQAQSMPIHGGTDSYRPSKYVKAVSIDALNKLESEL